MKKFLLALFILAVFSGFVFYIGWTEIKVKPDEIGVVISKTGGLDPEPVINGEFSWHWEFLLPTNAKIKTFSLKPLNVTKSVSGELPSGAVYASLFNSSENFNYAFDFSLGLSVSPENIIELLNNYQISDNEDLYKYMDAAADGIAQMATDYYLSQAFDHPEFRPESMRRNDLYRALKIDEEYPYIDLSVFSLTHCVFPDYSLYKQLQNQGILVVEDFNKGVKNNNNKKADGQRAPESPAANGSGI